MTEQWRAIEKLDLWIDKLSFFIWDISGLRWIWEHCRPPTDEEKKGRRPAATIVLWVIGSYTALFGLVSSRYENQADRIELRARAIVSQMANDEVRKEACAQIAKIQRMPCPVNPEYEKPWTVVKSLVANDRYEPVVELLKSTVVAWKKELSDVNLQDVDLEGALLWNADLRGALLVGSKLPGTNLVGADLRGAVLVKADLQGAILNEADLRGTLLWKANLQGAELFDTNLLGADLWGVSFTDCKYLYYSQLTGTCISQSALMIPRSRGEFLGREFLEEIGYADSPFHR